jgi:steroid delta-isomerase-like uncharacterized protein
MEERAPMTPNDRSATTLDGIGIAALTRRSALRRAGGGGMALAGLAFAAQSTLARGQDGSSDEDAAAIEALARRVIEAVNTGDADALDELVAGDFVGHVPLPLPGAGKGLAGVKENLAAIREALPDAHLEVADLVVAGDTVVVRGELTGTYSGTFLGVPPNGAALRITGVCIARIEDGKAVEHWSHFDAITALEQGGLFSLAAFQDDED